MTNTLTTSNELLNTNNINLQMLEEFKKTLDYAQTTKELYIKGARYFIEWLDLNKITSVSECVLVQYKEHLKESHAPSTINAYINALKRFYDYLETKGIYNNTKHLKGTKNAKNHKKGALTKNQVIKIYDSIDTGTTTGKRDNALIRLLIGTGLRTIEIERANISDIKQLNNLSVLYIQGKGHEEKDQYVILSESVKQALNDYLSTRDIKNPNEPLFTSLSDRNFNKRLHTRSIRNIVKSLYKQVGINSEFITTHSTRHTAVTLALLSGASLQEVQAFARHSNINTTLIYAHNLDRLNANTENKLDNFINE